MNLVLKTEKREMNYMNYSYALLEYFAFHICPSQQNVAESQATIPVWAIGRDWQLVYLKSVPFLLELPKFIVNLKLKFWGV